MGLFTGVACFFLAVVFVTGDHVAEHVDKTESDLRKAILENYDNYVRPIHHVQDAIQVSAALIPVALTEVDVKHQFIKMDTWFYMRWQDDNLHWDPSEYGGREALRLPYFLVWTPDLAVYYSTPDEKQLPSVPTNLVIYNNGTVIWVPPLTIKSRCAPPAIEEDKDHFHCTIQAGSWSNDASLLDVHERTADILDMAKDSYQETNPDWSLESMSAITEKKHFTCCPEEFSVIKFQMVLKKKHGDHKDDHHNDHHHDDHKDDHHHDGHHHEDHHHEEHKDDHEEDNHVTHPAEEQN